MRARKQGPKVAKKIPSKRRWYFRHSRVKLSTVLRNITIFQDWKYSKKDRNKSISITRKNVKDLVIIDLDDLKINYHKYIRLSILDGYILYKWLRLKRISFSGFSKQKICILSNPILSPSTYPEAQDFYYFCLEQDMNFKETWKWYIRSRTFIKAQDYKILCLLRQ
jgi:hypothetical protein